MLKITNGDGFTAYDWSEKMADFEKYFYNGKAVLEKIPEMRECSTFEDRGSNAEMLIFKDRKITYSCMYQKIGIGYSKKTGKCKEWVKIITNVYSDKGCLYEINPWKEYANIIGD